MALRRNKKSQPDAMPNEANPPGIWVLTSISGSWYWDSAAEKITRYHTGSIKPQFSRQLFRGYNNLEGATLTAANREYRHLLDARKS
jgi:hypothetical protein